ncbi:PTS glucitol/sorbitol transporter subunit IIA [Pseudoclavibacter helvolus]|uniref:PTS glucitol/sorbitol transporter subunit IIA n=1 Tax=Pseudoclavibacter helvolus TaxID=255205 RepID=UPI0024ACAD2B|nr:PTS glucitol/sorbitol transporter subunit IIA [Pseudoclavibacter helvolus]
MARIYESTVTGSGPEATSFLEERLLVTFGQDAPDALKDYCYIIDIEALQGTIEVGQRLVLGTESFPITAVGSVAGKNLEQLGHVTIAFTGLDEAEMDGTIYVDAGSEELPTLEAGARVAIES